MYQSIIKSFILLLCITTTKFIFAQQTAEDSLNNTSNPSSIGSGTSIGGYGNAFYSRDFNEKVSTINLERFVLFVGHKFNNRFSFFSEVEVEDAKVSGGEEGGEVAIEQCYVKFNLSKNNYLVGGLFLPRIGILNENHLPNTFNGNERTQVETYIIPSTWRELGVGFYGNAERYPISYTVALTNGLNSAAFEHGNVIREGRYEGRSASANNLALSGSIRYTKSNFEFQASAYYGGTVGLSKADADTLQLESGMFGTPVFLTEGNVQYSKNRFSARLLACIVSIPDASDINHVYNNNTPEKAYGFYGEVAYNLLNPANANPKELNLFFRFEQLDMNSAVAHNGVEDKTLNQRHIVIGLTYLPIKSIAIKGDVRLMNTGNLDPTFDEREKNTFLNLGLGFSF